MGKLTPQCRIFILTLLFATVAAKGDVVAFHPQPTTQFVPAGAVEYHPIHSLTSVGVDASSPPFRQCASCKCCASNDKTNCPVMQCCYRINCNLPNKPFGTCALVPETCNCNSCG